MKITSLEMRSIKCFKDESITFSPRINVIVGSNNSGKSTILNCINQLQTPRNFNSQFQRVGAKTANIKIFVTGESLRYFGHEIDTVVMRTNEGQYLCSHQGTVLLNHTGIQNNEPKNYIIPYQSKRKVAAFNELINSQQLNHVTGTLSNLYVKIDNISNPDFQPANNEYVTACEEILGFRVSATSSDNGKKATYIVRNEINIPVDTMGEGVTNLLGLIVDLCRVENKLFIIEEPENDIHPKALKKLLDLIIEKSQHNQFIITTHSNIVLRHLASETESKLFNVAMEFEEKIPTSTITELNTPELRQQALEELGYELNDLNIWDYWLFFEESSAEKIVREYFLPWYFPAYSGKTRTFSTAGISQIETKFEDFNRLFVYLHLTPTYKNKAWVIIDAGTAEKGIIDNLKARYTPSGWNEDNFIQLTHHDFEKYYPAIFSSQAEQALQTTNKAKKQEEKKVLLGNVIEWIDKDPVFAKEAFRESASEIIEVLSKIFAKH